jgi:Mg2+-importing ATPase
MTSHLTHARGGTATGRAIDGWWAKPSDAVLALLRSSPAGLSSTEAADRLQIVGRNALRSHPPPSWLRVAGRQLVNPLMLLLVAAAVVSVIAGEWIDAVIVLVIVAVSVAIGTSREHSAQAAADALRKRVRIHATAVRDGKPAAVPAEELVPGDVVVLAAGSLVPADGALLESADLFVSESLLTGESFPVEKRPGQAPLASALGARTGSLFLGTNIRSGSARMVVVDTATHTEIGSIAERLALRPPETEFDRGIKRFGYLLTIAMLVMVFAVFAAHMIRGRPAVETLLFAVALAVGLSPELLPAILSVNLARGAQKMSKRGVLVRRLSAIENLGSMDILCTDKTGTITEGVVELEGAYDAVDDVNAKNAARVLELASLNAELGSGVDNPLDEAILRAHKPDLAHVKKRAEIPFDFVRKRASVIVDDDDHGARLIVKGAASQVLDACVGIDRVAVDARVSAWAERGLRVLAVATRALDQKERYGRDDETGLTLAGFVAFLDRPKAGVAKALVDLKQLGVDVKIISGDSRAVTRHVAQLVGLNGSALLTGPQIDELHDEALWHAAEKTTLFAEVDPNQKERIILSFKKMGHVVGFLGDGVNDAPAMHAADTSLSVEKAVDVAREAADFVLLEADLDVIKGGIEEGRRTFANTLKYILTTTSANLGNMTSMAVASLFLPFLPLLAGQILLNNFLSDIPAIGLAGDDVDKEMIETPRRWDMKLIARFMIEFGLMSSLFDMLMFAGLLFLFRAGPAEFRTGWFVESLLTELVVALVLRTRRPFWRSRPGRVLLVSTGILIVVALVLPYLPLVGLLGFVPLPPLLLCAVVGLTLAYVAAVELGKRWFYRQR